MRTQLFIVNFLSIFSSKIFPLSLLAQYDDLTRNSNALTEGEEKEFLTFVRSSQLLVSSITNTREEVQRRDLELETLMKENTGNGTYLVQLTIY